MRSPSQVTVSSISSEATLCNDHPRPLRSVDIQFRAGGIISSALWKHASLSFGHNSLIIEELNTERVEEILFSEINQLERTEHVPHGVIFSTACPRSSMSSSDQSDENQQTFVGRDDNEEGVPINQIREPESRTSTSSMSTCRDPFSRCNHQFNVAFPNDTVLYDWYDDIYQRTPLHLSISRPFGFIHRAHAGVDGIFGIDDVTLPHYTDALRNSPLPGLHRMIQSTSKSRKSCTAIPRKSAMIEKRSISKKRWYTKLIMHCPSTARPTLIIGRPTNFVHHVHVGYDPISGHFTGLPAEWQAQLSSYRVCNTTNTF